MELNFKAVDLSRDLHSVYTLQSGNYVVICHMSGLSKVMTELHSHYFPGRPASCCSTENINSLYLLIKVPIYFLIWYSFNKHLFIAYPIHVLHKRRYNRVNAILYKKIFIYNTFIGIQSDEHCLGTIMYLKTINIFQDIQGQRK